MCTETRCKEISATERDRKDLRATSLAYGEIRFEPFITALMKVCGRGAGSMLCGVAPWP